MTPETLRNLVNYAGLAIFTTMLSMGQLLFKQVGLSLRGQDAGAGFVGLLRHPTLYAALALYGFATLLWIWLLSRIPLMQAYPWVAAGIVIVPLIGWFVFGERVGPLFWLGVGFIVAGILLTQIGSQPQ